MLITYFTMSSSYAEEEAAREAVLEPQWKTDAEMQELYRRGQCFSFGKTGRCKKNEEGHCPYKHDGSSQDLLSKMKPDPIPENVEEKCDSTEVVKLVTSDGEHIYAIRPLVRFNGGNLAGIMTSKLTSTGIGRYPPSPYCCFALLALSISWWYANPLPTLTSSRIRFIRACSSVFSFSSWCRRRSVSCMPTGGAGMILALYSSSPIMTSMSYSSVVLAMKQVIAYPLHYYFVPCVLV